MTMEERVKQMNDRAVDELVDAHKARKDEPLVLAVRFGTGEDDIHLLEVLSGFPGDDDDELLETEFEPSAQLRIVGKLHLVLASPAQVRSGLRRKAPLLEEVKKGKALHDDGSEIARDLKSASGL